MSDVPKFDCPHCKTIDWQINDTSSCIEGIHPTGESKGVRSGKYMEVISYVCNKCGYVVFFRIP